MCLHQATPDGGIAADLEHELARRVHKIEQRGGRRAVARRGEQRCYKDRLGRDRFLGLASDDFRLAGLGLDRCGGGGFLGNLLHLRHHQVLILQRLHVGWQFQVLDVDEPDGVVEVALAQREPRVARLDRRREVLVE